MPLHSLNLPEHSPYPIDGPNASVPSQAVIPSVEDDLGLPKDSELDWFKTLYDHLPVICLTLNGVGVIQHISQFGAMRLGYGVDALIGLPLHALVMTSAEEVTAICLQWLRSPTSPQTWQTRLYCRQGRPLSVQVAIQVVQRAEQTVLVLVCTELALEPAGHRTPAEIPWRVPVLALDNILSQAAVALVCFRLYPDHQWDYFYRSAGCEIIFGYAAAELAADPDLWCSCLLPEQWQTLEAQMYEAVVSQQTVTLEYAFRYKDGSLRWISSTISSVWDEAAGCWRGSFVDTNITDRKRLELALEQSRRELTYVLNTATAAIFNLRVFPNGRWEYDYVSAGCEAIYGYDVQAHEEDANLWRQILHPEDRDRVLQEMYAAIRSEKNFTHVFRVFHKSGALRWIASTYTSRWDAVLQCWRVTVVDVDVSDRHRVEDALCQSEARLAEAQHIAQLGYWEFDLATRKITWSAEQYRIYQWDPCVEVTFDVLSQRFLPADRERLITAVNRAIAHGQPYILDLQLMRPDGTTGCVEVRGKVVWDQRGMIIRLCGTTQDITQRKYLETQLERKSQREHLLNQVIKAIRHSLDWETVFETATHQTGRLLALDRVQIAQYRAPEDSWQVQLEYVAQPDQRQWPGPLIAGFATPLSHQLKRLETVRLERVSEHLDPALPPFTHLVPGHWLLVPLQVDACLWGVLALARNAPVESWQDWEVELAEAIADQLAIAIQQLELFRQVNQLNSGLEATVEERTAQLTRALQFEQLLRRITDKVRDSLDEEQILQTAVQELQVELKLGCCDAGIYHLESQTSTIAYETTVAVKSAKNTIVPMGDYPDIYRQLFAEQSFQFCAIHQSQHRPKDYAYTILVCPIYDDQGLLGDLWLFRPREQCFDPGELRLVEQVATQCAIALRQSRLYDAAQQQVEELGKLNQLKDDFLSTVSHELRSPMANIKMATEMLEMYLGHTEFLADEKARSAQYFRILQEECDRESSLINDLLDLSRLDADSEPLMVHTLEVSDWILHLSEAFVHRTEGHQQVLVFDLAPDVPPLTTDFSFLERVLTELLHNACKYTPAGGTISVSTRFLMTSPASLPFPMGRKDGTRSPLSPYPRWQITICNTGVEIPLAEQERIFDKFYRVPNNDPWRTGGTGLGLALVKKRVERLGGQIEVTSADLRTTFVIEIPGY